jgi:hypothetical protein
MPNRFNNRSSSYSDGSEVQGNRYNHWIEFYHIPTVSFKAFLTSFSDDYKSNWNLETVMGRMDPLPTFTNTTRTITVDWDVPAATPSEARQNFQRVQSLNGMLYPSYENGVMVGAPLFKVRMMNFVKNESSSGISGASESGLIAIIDGFSFNPDLDAGFIEESNGQVFPKNIKMSCTMNIQHTSRRGFLTERQRFTRNQEAAERNRELRQQNNSGQAALRRQRAQAAGRAAAAAAAERRREGEQSQASTAEEQASADEITGS